MTMGLTLLILFIYGAPFVALLIKLAYLLKP